MTCNKRGFSDEEQSAMSQKSPVLSVTSFAKGTLLSLECVAFPEIWELLVNKKAKPPSLGG